MKIQLLRFPIISCWRLGLWNGRGPTDRFQAKAGPGHDPGRSPVRAKKTRQIKDLERDEIRLVAARWAAFSGVPDAAR